MASKLPTQTSRRLIARAGGGGHGQGPGGGALHLPLTSSARRAPQFEILSTATAHGLLSRLLRNHLVKSPEPERPSLGSLSSAAAAQPAYILLPPFPIHLAHPILSYPRPSCCSHSTCALALAFPHAPGCTLCPTPRTQPTRRLSTAPVPASHCPDHR